MILRRITLHVKEQNWTAIAIDFVVVVVVDDVRQAALRVAHDLRGT